MDHSHHDHAAMGHMGMDHGHGDMDMPMKCSMNMLFTWSTENLCIVFSGWRITGTLSLLLSLLAIVALGAGYEGVRSITRRYEVKTAERLENMPRKFDSKHKLHAQDPCVQKAKRGMALNEDGVITESSSLLTPGNTRAQAEQSTKIIKAVLYAIQVFYSFFIMLLFMTYNGWIMIAVAVGAFVGYLLFNPGSATKCDRPSRGRHDSLLSSSGDDFELEPLRDSQDRPLPPLPDTPSTERSVSTLPAYPGSARTSISSPESLGRRSVAFVRDDLGLPVPAQ